MSGRSIRGSARRIEADGISEALGLLVYHRDELGGTPNSDGQSAAPAAARAHLPAEPVDQYIARAWNAAAGADGIDRDRMAAFVEIVHAAGRTS